MQKKSLLKSFIRGLKTAHCAYPHICLAILISFLVTGCAGMELVKKEVEFKDHRQVLNLKDAEALPSEKEGILLRFNIPDSGKSSYTRTGTVFFQVEGGEGMSFRYEENGKIFYRPGKEKDSILVSARGSIESDGGTIAREYEMGKRGNIIRLVSGRHNTSKAKFEVTEWNRTHIFPEVPVTPGDSWTYWEKMEIDVESSLFSRRNTVPERLNAKSTLAGFAVLGGKRCAVIETSVFQKSTESVATLFCSKNFSMSTNLRDITYFDYKDGRIIGQVTWTSTTTMDENNSIVDFSQSQSIFTSGN